MDLKLGHQGSTPKNPWRLIWDILRYSVGNMWSVDSLPSPQSAGIWMYLVVEVWRGMASTLLNRCCLGWNLAIFEPSRRMLPSNVRTVLEEFITLPGRHCPASRMFGLSWS